MRFWIWVCGYGWFVGCFCCLKAHPSPSIISTYCYIFSGLLLSLHQIVPTANAGLANQLAHFISAFMLYSALHELSQVFQVIWNAQPRNETVQKCKISCLTISYPSIREVQNSGSIPGDVINLLTVHCGLCAALSALYSVSNLTSKAGHMTGSSIPKLEATHICHSINAFMVHYYSVTTTIK